MTTLDLDKLMLEVDGVTRSFAEWTSDFVDSYYPNVGQDCYRVPALHFNQQKLSFKSVDGLHQQQDPTHAIGDLAHTLVLEKLEELSQHLRSAGEGPLFIISTVQFDNYLAKLQPTRPKRKKKKSTGQADVSDVSAPERSKSQPCPSENLKESNKTEKAQPGSSVSDVTDKEKQLLPPRPADKGRQRGELDVMLLHRNGGVILVEIKSVGHVDSSWEPSEKQLQEYIGRRVQRAEQQLRGGADVLHYIMPDLTLPHVTLVVALPYVTREQLTQIISTNSPDPELRFLCQDDLWPSITGSPMPSTQTEDGSAGCSAPPVQAPGLMDWWHISVCADLTERLSLHCMRTIVGRVCGLMSVVSVWTTSKPRVEVRTIAQAISETGRRLSDIVLLPSQSDLLAQPSLQHLWLTGPMGSGKTIMLQLKGRQWLSEGKRVIVINVRTVCRGRPHGHVLEEGIREGAQSHPGTGSVERYDIALDDFKFETLEANIASGGSVDNACFLVDEVLSGMSVIAHKLVQHFPDCPIWCVASYITPVPSAFKQYRLGTVLRNPPSVQLMLKELDLNPRHKHIYTTRSAARGLSCDGPPVIFIEHSKHNTGMRHLDCSQCADELADVFETNLGLQLQVPTLTEPGQSPIKVEAAHSQPNTPEQYRNAVEAAPLSFRDVLVLLVFPFTVYKHVVDYHWELSVPEMMQYMIYMGMSRFFAGLRNRGVPFRIVVDNTLKEVAFPPEDEVIITDVMGVHSLERKVVVFVRGGPPLTQEEIAEHLSRYRFVQTGSCPGQQPQPASQTSLSSSQQLLKTPSEIEDDNKQLHLFAAAMYEVRDFLYPRQPASFSSTDFAKAFVRHILGNTMVAAIHHVTGNIEQKKGFHTRETLFACQKLVAKLRVGMEYRTDLPILSASSHTQQDSTEAAAVQKEDVDSKSVTELDCVFLVPGLKLEGEGEERKREVRRIQQAMAGLSEDDLDWDYFAATRCLSQYISILP